VPGDRARLLDTGEIEFLGRDSVTINSGGEKVFAEEVEGVIAANPEVYDVVVTARPHPRWGEEIVAIVSLRPDMTVSEGQLRERATKHLARYKVPKHIAFVDHVPRNEVGKPDYVWARERAATV
jgi:acyl-CoA synthetase (AMP-forming)/AMP-acid ligase II